MKIKLLIFFTFIFNVDAIYAQTFEWARGFGSNGSDFGYSIATDNSGNVYTIGVFEGTVDFAPGALSFNLTSVGNKDIFIQKMDPSGNFLWAKSFGSEGNDFGMSLTVDDSGNIYATGYFINTVNFNPFGENGNLTSAGNSDIFILKLDTLGNFMWAKSFGDEVYDIAWSISLDMSDNIYVAGSFVGTVNFNSGEASGNLTTEDLSVFVLKLDPTGDFLWARSFGQSISGMAIDNMGYVYTTGTFQNTVDFDPGENSYLLTSSNIYLDVFVQKMDSDGNFLWAKSFGGNYADEVRAIAVDASGNVYTTGHFNNAVDFDPGDGVSILTTSGAADIFVQKLDTSGDFLWAKSFGGTLIDLGRVITIDSVDNLYLAGSFTNTVNFNPGSDNGTLTSQCLADIFIQKMDSFGNVMWVNSFGGSSLDNVSSIMVESSGYIYATGYFSTTVDFDFSPGTYTLNSSGLTDAFVLKLNSNLLAVDEYNLDTNFMAFPNPTYSEVTIKSEKILNNVSLNLSNLQGQQLFYQTYDVFTDADIEMPEEAGVYFLTVQSQKIKSTIKIIKK